MADYRPGQGDETPGTQAGFYTDIPNPQTETDPSRTLYGQGTGTPVGLTEAGSAVDQGQQGTGFDASLNDPNFLYFNAQLQADFPKMSPQAKAAAKVVTDHWASQYQTSDGRWLPQAFNIDYDTFTHAVLNVVHIQEVGDRHLKAVQGAETPQQEARVLGTTRKNLASTTAPERGLPATRPTQTLSAKTSTAKPAKQVAGSEKQV